MIPSQILRRCAFTFGPTFAVLYVIAVRQDLALFAVYPTRLLPVATLQEKSEIALSTNLLVMHWYGWMATAVVGALLLSLIAVITPAQWTSWLKPDLVWILPTLAMIACVYLTLP